MTFRLTQFLTCFIWAVFYNQFEIRNLEEMPVERVEDINQTV